MNIHAPLPLTSRSALSQVTEILPGCGVATLPRPVAGVHTLDQGHIAHIRNKLRRMGFGEHSAVLLLAAAHQGSTGGKPLRVALVLLLSGHMHVIRGGERAGACGVCGARADVEVMAENLHVDRLSAVTATADATDPSWCSVSLQFSAHAPAVTLTMTSEAAGCLLSHIRTLRSLSRGIPLAPDELAVTGTLAALPWAQPQPRRHDLAILLGTEIALGAGGLGALRAAENTNMNAIVQTLIANGLLDFSKTPVGRQMIEALLPSLSQNLARGTPVLKGVKFSPSSSGAEQFSALVALLSTSWSVQKLSLKDAGITGASWDSFVKSSIASGGCSQCSDLSLAGNPELANVMLGQTFSAWPRMPVMDLASAVPVYTSLGSLRKLSLDNCSLPHARAADVLAGLLYHAHSLVGLSLAKAIVGPASDSAPVTTALGNLLDKSMSLGVLDVSDCNLLLQDFPASSKAPLQVMNLGGNFISESASNVNALVRSVSKSLQLVSLRGTKVAGPLSPVLCDGMADLDFVADFSGIEAAAGLAAAIQVGNGAPRAIVLRGATVEQGNEVASLHVGSSCTDLDIRISASNAPPAAAGGGAVLVVCPPNMSPGMQIIVNGSFAVTIPNSVMPGQQFQVNLPSGSFFPVGTLLGSSSLTALNISKCGLGGSLATAISTLATQLTLTSLDISNNNATGAIGALCTHLGGNRSLSSLKIAGNSPTFDEIAMLRKFFGGVNAQTGVLWGNKTIVLMDVPSKDFNKDLEQHMQSFQQMIAQGTQDMATGQRVIKSAYQYPNHYRRPNQQTKQAGIAQKVRGKKAIAQANKMMEKLKTFTSEIGDAIKRNQNIMSLKEQSKMGPGLLRAVAKQSAVVERKRAKYTAMVTTKRAKRLRDWDDVMRSNQASYYPGWRQQYGATFDLAGWSKLKALVPADHLTNPKIETLTAKTEAELLNQDQHKTELEESVKQLKQLEKIQQKA